MECQITTKIINFNKHQKFNLKKNQNNQFTYFIEKLEPYTIELIKNTSYYFDLSDVLDTQFRLSLFPDGLK